MLVALSSQVVGDLFINIVGIDVSLVRFPPISPDLISEPIFFIEHEGALSCFVSVVGGIGFEPMTSSV